MSESNKRMAEYVMDQLRGLDGVRCIPMMGGYIFYIHNRVFGGIYESGDLMVKITDASKKYMPGSIPQPPLEGAKDMLPVTILEDHETLQKMVAEMYPELPERNTKKRKR